MKTTSIPQKTIIAREIGRDSFSVDGKILTKSEVEMLCALMPDSQLVWVKYFTKKKPWEVGNE
jgi:hypothetical protein